MVKLVEAGSHPDMRWLERLVNEKDRQARAQHHASTRCAAFPSCSTSVRRCPIGASRSSIRSTSSSRQAPTHCSRCSKSRLPTRIFFLVSHAPGRLLPTIRSRCRRLDFQALDADAMTSILEAKAPEMSAAERQRIIAMSFGSAGRALAFAELGLAKLEDAAVAILRQGDPTNARRSDLASELGKKAAADRYAAFLDLAPTLIAREARRLERRADANARSTLTPRRASSRPLRHASRSTLPRPFSRSAGSSPKSPNPLP